MPVYAEQARLDAAIAYLERHDLVGPTAVRAAIEASGYPAEVERLRARVEELVGLNEQMRTAMQAEIERLRARVHAR